MNNIRLSNETIGIISSTTKYINEQYGSYIFNSENKRRLTGIYKDFINREDEAKNLVIELLNNNVFTLLLNNKIKQAEQKIEDCCLKKNYSNSSIELLIEQLEETFGYSKNDRKKSRKKVSIHISRTVLIVATVILIMLSSISIVTWKLITRFQTLNNHDDAYEVFVSTNLLNMRNRPSDDGAIICVLNLNESLEVLEITASGWYKVKSKENHKTGYVNSSDISKEKTSPKLRRDSSSVIEDFKTN